MGKSEVTTRNSLKALEGQGLIVIYAHYLKNGARLENEYELTPLGERALRLGLQAARRRRRAELSNAPRRLRCCRRFSRLWIRAWQRRATTVYAEGDVALATSP